VEFALLKKTHLDTDGLDVRSLTAPIKVVMKLDTLAYAQLHLFLTRCNI